MTTLEAYRDLLALEVPVLETKEAAACLRTTPQNTLRILRGLEGAGLAQHLRRGLWSVGREPLDPFVVAPYLTAPFPAYVSMWSALHHHGMIEQIPARVYVVSLDHAKTVETSVGEFAVHHIAPELFGGFTAERGRLLARAEKALFDTVYLQAQRGGRSRMPELEMPEGFAREVLDGWVESIPARRLQTITRREIDRILATAG